MIVIIIIEKNILIKKYINEIFEGIGFSVYINLKILETGQWTAPSGK